MFTGIIMAVGQLRAAEPAAGDVRLVIDAGGLALDRVAFAIRLRGLYA